MFIRLPRPRDGWRQFAGEVGIIVLGILIALGFQQLASAATDRANAATVRANIRAEIQSDLNTIALRQESEPCIQARLREIASFLDASERGLKPAALSWVGAPYAPLLYHTSFQSAQDAGRFSLLSQAEQQQFATFYINVDDFNEANTREWYDWAQLRTLAGQRVPLTPSEITRLRTALQDARATDWFVRIDVGHSLDHATELGIKVNQRADTYQTASVCLPSNMPYAEAVKRAGSKHLAFPE